MTERSALRWVGIVLLLTAAPHTASVAHAQGCFPPEEPYPYPPPRDDPELRDFINEEYGRYALAIEGYIACLDEERRRAIGEARVVMDRWIRHFGTDVAIRDD